MKDKLIDLLKDTLSEWECDVTDKTIEEIADHLSANGVIVPPCKIGEKIFIVITKRPKANFPKFSFVKETRLTYLNLERVIAEFGKTVFLTRKEADAALARMKGEGE